MSKIKRTFTFILAVITCMTFCCVNSGAESYRYCGFTGPSVIEYFSSTSAYAYAYITDWAEDENSTDLYATTYAFIEDYDYKDGFDDLAVSVTLTVRLSDGDSCYHSYGYEDLSSGDSELDAVAFGNDCLNSVDHYSIINFDSEHEVKYYIISEDDDEPVGWVNDGPVISINPEY